MLQQGALPGWSAALSWCEQQGGQACFLLPPMCAASANPCPPQNLPARSEQQTSARCETQTSVQSDTQCSAGAPREPSSRPEAEASREGGLEPSLSSHQESASLSGPTKGSNGDTSEGEYSENELRTVGDPQQCGSAGPAGRPPAPREQTREGNLGVERTEAEACAGLDGGPSAPREQAREGQVGGKPPEAGAEAPPGEPAEAQLPDGGPLYDAVIGEAFHCLIERALRWHDACPRSVR